MEQNMFSKFNLYDQMGYLLVGSIAILVIHLDTLVLQVPWKLEITALNLVVWFIGAYFVGHLVQAAANIFIKENKTEFTESEKEVLGQVKIYFGLEKLNWNEAYLLCYMLSLAKDITGHVQSFNAYYSLYRGWFVVFLVETTFLAISSLVIHCSLWTLALLATSGVCAVLFYRRTHRFFAYSRTKAIQTFVVVQKLHL